MAAPLSDRQWEQCRKLADVARARYFDSILGSVAEVLERNDLPPEDRFFELRHLLHDQSDDVVLMFEDLERHNAVTHLAMMRAEGLLADAELGDLAELVNAPLHQDLHDQE